MTKQEIKARLEYLRGELRAERVSYGEISELQSLAAHIAPDDVELLEAADVREQNVERAMAEQKAFQAAARMLDPFINWDGLNEQRRCLLPMTEDSGKDGFDETTRNLLGGILSLLDALQDGAWREKLCD